MHVVAFEASQRAHTTTMDDVLEIERRHLTTILL